MNILTTYTLKSLQLNKKRTAVTILGVILSSALICGVFLLGQLFLFPTPPATPPLEQVPAAPKTTHVDRWKLSRGGGDGARRGEWLTPARSPV